MSIIFFFPSEKETKFFGRQMENSGRQCFFLRSQRLFPLTNKIKYKRTYHSETTTNELKAGHMRSFVRSPTVSSHFCSFRSQCANIDSRCANALQTNRELLIYDFLCFYFYLLSSTRHKKRIHKGEALRLLRTNLSHLTFNKNMQSFKTRLKNKGYPNEFLEKHFF